MHSPYWSSPGLPVGVAMYCEISQRCANWSQTTTGSPSLWSLHSPFVFAQSWLIGVEVRSTAPVFEYTAKSLLTAWTYCVAPTSPSVSGGNQLQLLGWAHGGPNGRQMPSKFWIGAESGPDPFRCWTTGSCALEPPPRSDSLSRVCNGPGITGRIGSWLPAGASPW